MTKEGAYERAGALDGVDAVCHVASPVPEVADLAPPAPGADVDWVRDMVEPAIQGTLTILRAASKYPQVMHVIVTSSITAIRALAALSDPKAMTTTLTDDDWSTARKDDPANQLNAYPAYFASKTEAERAAWSYVKQAQPHYTLASFCPPVMYGPAGIKLKRPEDFGTPLGVFYRLMKGSRPPWPLDGVVVDARDVAEAFRLTIEKPLRDNQRFLLCAGAQTGEELLSFTKTLDPSPLQDRSTTLDTSKARQLLGWKPRTKRETYVDTAAYLQEQDKSMSK